MGQNNNPFSRLTRGWSSLEKALLIIIILLCIGSGVLVTIFGGIFFISEVEQIAEEDDFVEPTATTPAEVDLGEGGDLDTGGLGPTISLSPAVGPPGSTVTIQGTGWPAGSKVIISLVPSEPPNYAISSAIVEGNGGFTVDIIVPSDPRWLNESPVPVLVELDDGSQSAQTFLNLTSPDDATQVTPIPIDPATPIPAQPTATAPPPAANVPQLTVTTNLNVRQGPGTNYDILGVLHNGQKAEVVGRNADGTWWQIKFVSGTGTVGWVAAQFTQAQNIANVPVVQPPAPPTPVPVPPTSTPDPGVTITEWRGEYYNNPDLNGAPVLVRNDTAVSFDWGPGSPDPAVPADNFSARWTRTLNFSAGTYRFYARSDDGVRLWVDNTLLINQWRETSPVTYQADIYLPAGLHNIRMEYFERVGGAVAVLSWERVDDFPEWRAEYFNNPDLRDAPVVVRNEASIYYNWGNGAPIAGVPSDNFSIRWTRTVDLDNSRYVFRVRADDGIRVWVDNELIIDRWRDGDSGSLEVERDIRGGRRQIRVEYYERGGNAFVGLSWRRTDDEDDPPTAIITAPGEGETNQPLTFDGDRSQRGDHRIVRYEWDFGDGTRAHGERVSHTYNQPGVYRVSLTVTDSRGLRDRSRISIEIKDQLEQNTPPIAVIDAPSAAEVGQAVGFDAGRSQSVNPVARYEWTFGDGTTAEGRSVTHTYGRAGTYSVNLTVVTNNGLRGSSNVQVRIDSNVQPDRPPIAVIKAPDSVQTGQSVDFDASNSKVFNKVTSIDWSFGDGTTASGLHVMHVYNAPGIYNVTLTISDERGLSNSVDKQITVSQQLVAGISAPPSAETGQAVDFSASPAGADSYNWDLGDGTTASGLTISHTYAQAGDYTINLTVSQGGQQSQASYTIQITEPPRPPVAAISGPTQGQVGSSVQFEAVNNAQNSTPVVSINWDFGDGATGQGTPVNHTYGAAGDYTVTLTLTDQNGQSSQATAQIQIMDQPTNPVSPPVPVLSGPATAQTSQTVTFDASNSAQGSSPVTGIAWDLGDGTTGSGVTIDHIYNTAGTYQVTLTLTDEDGRTASDTRPIDITDAPQPTATPSPTTGNPPVAVFNGPQQAQVGGVVSFDGGFSYGDNPIVDWAWEFGDGATGSGMGIDHTYSAPGTYSVFLTVTDDQGLTGKSNPFPINIADASTGPTPTAVPTQPPGQPPTPTPTLAPPTATPQSNQPTPTPEPPTPTPDVPTATPPPAAQPPQAAFDAPPQAQVGETVTFDAGFSTGTAPLVDFAWNFGDGGGDSGMGTTYVYNAPGTYQVTLTVTDQNGLSAQTTVPVNIVAAPVAPTATPVPAQPTETPVPAQPIPTPEPPTSTPEPPTPTPEPPTPTPEPPTPTPEPATPTPEPPTPTPTLDPLISPTPGP